MSLTTRRRSEIYEKLVPLLGEENAEAMMAEFPATEHDQLVTRDHLRAEMAELRSELRGEISSVESRLRGEISASKSELQAQIGALKDDMHSLATRNLLAMMGLLVAGMGFAASVG